MTHREASKQVWSAGSAPPIEAINMGSFQRIADATEKMASSYVSMEADRDNYRKWYRIEFDAKVKAHRRISALQGVITRMKKAKHAA